TADTDTALFSGLRSDFTITFSLTGTTIVTDNRGTDGIDRVTNMERLQFTDQSVDAHTCARVAVAPGAPVIGAAVAGNASAVVNWTAPTDNGGSAITGYDVQAFAGTSTVA